MAPPAARCCVRSPPPGWPWSRPWACSNRWTRTASARGAGPAKGPAICAIFLDSVYGQEVQPYLADLDRRQRLLGERLQALRAASSGASPRAGPVAGPLFRPRGQAARLDQALRAHTERWQTVLGACGLMPGGG